MRERDTLNKYVSLKGLIPRSTGVRPLVVAEELGIAEADTP